MSKKYEVMLDVVLLETHYVEANSEDDAYEEAVRASNAVAKGGEAKLFQVREIEK